MGVWLETSRPDPTSYTLCAVVEGWYKMSTEFVEYVLGWFDDVCRMTISIINAWYNVLKTFVDSIVDAITATLNNCIDAMVGLIDEETLDWLTRVRENLCEMLIKCEIIFRHIINQVGAQTDGSLPDFTSLHLDPNTDKYVFNEINDSYEWFKKMICEFSLKEMISAGAEATKELLAKWLDDLIGNSRYGIDRCISEIRKAWKAYDAAIRQPLKDVVPNFDTIWRLSMGHIIPKEVFDENTGNIFDLMDAMDMFMECAFAMCEFGRSLVNFKDDKRKKYHVDWRSRILETPNSYNKAIQLASDLNKTMRSWKNSEKTKVCFGL